VDLEAVAAFVLNNERPAANHECDECPAAAGRARGAAAHDWVRLSVVSPREGADHNRGGRSRRLRAALRRGLGPGPDRSHRQERQYAGLPRPSRPCSYVQPSRVQRMELTAVGVLHPRS
jgi:hypothetical protein